MKDETSKEKKLGTEYGSDEYMRRMALVYKEGWGKSPSGKGPSFASLMVGFVAGTALFLGLIYETTIFQEKRSQKEAKKAQQEYAILEKLADVDGDGKLSGIERTLMFERLDRDKDDRLDADWRFVQSRSDRWDYRETTRIEKAINRYKADLGKK